MRGSCRCSSQAREPRAQRPGRGAPQTGEAIAARASPHRREAELLSPRNQLDVMAGGDNDYFPAATCNALAGSSLGRAPQVPAGESWESFEAAVTSRPSPLA